jgi:hypothetical protein
MQLESCMTVELGVAGAPSRDPSQRHKPLWGPHDLQQQWAAVDVGLAKTGST